MLEALSPHSSRRQPGADPRLLQGGSRSVGRSQKSLGGASGSELREPQDPGPPYPRKARGVPTRLPDGCIGPVRNKPVELSDGSLLCGASTEDGGWAVHMERAVDRVRRWEKTPKLAAPAGLEAIQPAILGHGDGTFQILCRTKQGFLAESWSKDDGRTWSELRPTALPNPNGAIDGLRLSDGRFLLVYNDSAADRGTLSLAISTDGRDWSKVISLESAAGEFSYPAVIQARNGLVHITYSWNRQRIRHAVVDPMKLEFHALENGRLR